MRRTFGCYAVTALYLAGLSISLRAAGTISVSKFLFDHRLESGEQCCNCRRLLRTNRAATHAGGHQPGRAAWSTSPISFSSSSGSFSTFLQFQITHSGGIDPADGIVVVLQPVSSGVGGVGGSIGNGGVTPSVGVEFDTYQNSWDSNSNHVGIDTNGNLTSLVIATPGGVRRLAVSPKPLESVQRGSATPFYDGVVWRCAVPFLLELSQRRSALRFCFSPAASGPTPK